MCKLMHKLAFRHLSLMNCHCHSIDYNYTNTLRRR